MNVLKFIATIVLILCIIGSFYIIFGLIDGFINGVEVCGWFGVNVLHIMDSIFSTVLLL